MEGERGCRQHLNTMMNSTHQIRRIKNRPREIVVPSEAAIFVSNVQMMASSSTLTFNQIGSVHQNMNLWLSTYEKKMSVVKFDSSDSIEVPHKYNPKVSSSAVYVSASSGQEEIYNLDESSKTLNALTLTGNEIEDTVTVGFGNDLYTSFRSIFLGVDGSMNQKFASKIDGFVGLAPYVKETAVMDRSFLW